MTLGEKILDLRRKNGMSQDTLAEKLEVSRQAISKWERDEAMPETDKIVRLAQLFSVSTDYLLTDAPEPYRQQQFTARPEKSTAEERVERFVRRHGYKAGYIMTAVGAFICILSIGLRLLWPAVAGQFFSGTFGWFDEIVQSGDQVEIEDAYGNAVEDLDKFFGDGVIVDEHGNTYNSFEEMLGGNNFADPFDEFERLEQIAQQQMHTAVQAQANIFLIGLLPGGMLLAAGVFVTVKGKKIAAKAEH